MKRFGLVMMISCICLLGACTQKQIPDAELKEVKLSNFERNLLSAVSANAVYYNVKINNKEVRTINLYIDHYKNGKYEDQVVAFNQPIEAVKDGVQIMYVLHRIDDTHMKWSVSIATSNKDGSENGLAGTSNDIKIAENDSGASGGVSLPKTLALGKKTVVGTDIHTSKESIAIRSDIKTKEDIKEVTNYEDVFLMSVEIK
ncbi:hypothetical protein P5G51_008220 [Virgibacillus sp. 179-BFC.A HS]|uniref:Lipoprotein n=1 Tax=Tigheibacillus jepli TaxID=3035914 RepID=A0ABU5CIQ8_9BACI|nr:hypothetical protein [Virgibacillus sp. 179-BFC.A HS]MDY0405385.1 hypothetical protein [Virgibacillus sp. 179-BFC.A HS]